MRNSTLRRVAVIGATLAVLFGSAACSSTGSSSSDAKKLVVYSADPANTASYQKVANEFGKKNNVSISIISYPSAKFIQQFSPAVNSKAQIDVVLANGQDVRYLQSHGLLSDLGDSVKTDDLIPAAYEPFTINNNLYGVGVRGVNVTAFVYNQAIFDKYGLAVPKTTDDLIAIAAKLKGTGIAPVSVPGADVYAWPIWMMQMLQQTTANTPTETTFKTLKTGSPAFNSSNYVAGWSEMARLGAGNVFANGWQGLGVPAAVSLFSQGKAAMFFGGSWDISTIAQQAPSMDIKAFAFPNFVPGVKSAPFGGVSSAAGVYGKVDPSRKNLATQFVNYLSSAAVDEELLAVGSSGISLPTVKSAVPPVPPTHAALQNQLIKEFLPSQSTFLDWYWPKEVTAAYQQKMVGVTSGTSSPEEAAKAVQTAFEVAKQGGYTAE